MNNPSDGGSSVDTYLNVAAACLVADEWGVYDGVVLFMTEYILCIRRIYSNPSL